MDTIFFLSLFSFIYNIKKECDMSLAKPYMCRQSRQSLRIINFFKNKYGYVWSNFFMKVAKRIAISWG